MKLPLPTGIVLGVSCLALFVAAAHVHGSEEDTTTTTDALSKDTTTTINGRRPVNGEPVKLGFSNVTIEKTIPFIVESTGKIVIPQKAVLGKTITVINDQPIPRDEALDMLFIAFQQADVGVVETDKVISLRLIEEVDRQDVPVIGPFERVEDRRDLGNIYRKVFLLRSASAENVGDVIKDSLPSYAKLLVDKDGNQLVVLGNVAMLQRIEKLVDALDQPAAASLETETFRLRYADAELIAKNIKELYGKEEGTPEGTGGNRERFARFMMERFNGSRGGRGGQDNQTATVTSENLRVTANVQQNSVTVIAEQNVIDQVRTQIENQWDKPIPEEAVIPRIYDLENSDPVKVRDLLQNLFEGKQATRNQPATEPVGRLTGQFTFQAIEDSNRLVVIGKTAENLKVIDELIKQLDRPQTAGLPKMVELRHADAEDLAEQINALLSQDGTLAQIRRSGEGLTTNDSSESPFATGNNNNNNQDNTQQEGTITFWWQRNRPSNDERPTSNLVGKVRVVPIARQNSLLILGPPEYHQSIVNFIEMLDQPGRQVLISAVVAEITLDDATSLGFRWSNSSSVFDSTLTDNRIGVTGDVGITQNDALGSIFDTSVLSANVDINVLLDLLEQKTGIKILSEPRIFTGDNQEAVFFDGQDIPFVTDTQTTDTGNVVNSFDYRSVGIQLRVRPRITKERNVDLRVNIELSSIREGETLFGGFIVDRRETTTQLIVGDAQTVVISGIMRQQDNTINRKVPLLGDLPLVGALFRSTTRSTTNTELVAFITPIVVENPSEMDDINKQPRDRLEELREMLREDEATGPVDQDIIWGTPVDKSKREEKKD